MDEYRGHDTHTAAAHAPPRPGLLSALGDGNLFGVSWPVLLILLAVLGLYLWLGKSGDTLGLLQNGLGGILGGILK